ncbi:transcription termination factor Rho [Mycobacterium sp. Root135]|uniref:transcription termination factor Rho n=1 Tax=Mycobacterium sp. Root135 TaxID=1736457 RepID=UPI0006FD966D|nr:transcription termination factor Rho [Mycobacterium sp. Root135]KQY03367.1 transcription termination factor Rho [Mycobacterium sp. Root135]
MSDTDLITAEGSSDGVELPNPVNSPISEAVSAAPAKATTVVASGDRPTALTAMVLPDLRALAGQLGIKGSSGMRKSELIAAIRENRGDNTGASAAAAPAKAAAEPTPAVAEAAPAADVAAGDAPERPVRARRERRGASRSAGAAVEPQESGEQTAKVEQPQDKAPEVKAATEQKAAPEAAPADKPDKGAEKAAKTDDADKKDAVQAEAPRTNERQNNGGRQGNRNDGGNDRNDGGGERQNNRNEGGNNRNEGGNNRNDGGGERQNNRNDGGNNRNDNANNRGNNNANSNNNNNNSNNNVNDDDDDERGGRRGRRFRDRRRRGERGDTQGGGGNNDRDTELREDDVVQPVAGILDVLDNYAFVRTSGYLAGTNDVYVSMNMVRKNGLRRGDAIIGAVRVAREGESGANSNSQNPRQKFNPLVRLDSVNGGPVEDARNRPDFQKLTPLYPNQRLRLETKSELLTTRVIDLIMPIGKGQRALIVSPPKAGKTMVLQSIANAITVNNPECHLMVVLVDERPEEVTDMQRSVKGEVIASTFDRPPSDHTAVAELAIERAKRLVEQGKDVVVLLDSITRLGRAYNNASPASGRILSGGVDSTALYPPKRFLGAARNIEDGGSLTIIATALVETGSMGDTVIYEEFKGTGNAELKLDRKIAERRVFPAVDVNPSNTRKDELLLSTDEFAVVHKLRRVLSGLDSHQAIDLLMSQLRKTKNNYEFLVQVSKNTPGTDND